MIAMGLCRYNADQAMEEASMQAFMVLGPRRLFCKQAQRTSHQGSGEQVHGQTTRKVWMIPLTGLHENPCHVSQNLHC